MQIATLAFNKAARTEFMKDFHTPDARASALETIAKATRIYDRASEYYERRMDRTNPTRKLDLPPPAPGMTRRLADRSKRIQAALALQKFEHRKERINTIAGAKLDAIRENQHKQQNARTAAAQERPRQAVRSIFNRAARETPTRAFNRSR